jgi:lipopolysaccharide transport system ATP-binding protein
MSQSAIVVENLSKRYLIGHRRTSPGHYKYVALRDVVAQEMRNFARKAADIVRGRQVVQGDEVEEFWALKDVSFEVKEGEVLGIVGRNGAGKSTLLKILSRITEPTKGRVSIRGRVSSLLEVGTGFHPELTGRENIFLNGAILGMTQREIRKKFDEIVEFAEVEKFLDTPVKYYSSGMYVRLAFAVAAHLEPEILIVDEVLAVGDVEFQRKCLGKMREVSRDQGRTVLFVTHNVGTLMSVCPTAIWLDKGSVRERGPTREIVSKYLAQKTQNQDRVASLSHVQRPQALQDDRLRFETIEWLSPLPLRNYEPLRATITFTARKSISDVSVGIGFSSAEGRRILTYESDFQDGIRRSVDKPGTYSVEVAIALLPLTPGIYTIDFASRSGDRHFLDYIEGVFELEVVAGQATPGFVSQNVGCVRLTCDWLWSDAGNV